MKYFLVIWTLSGNGLVGGPAQVGPFVGLESCEAARSQIIQAATTSESTIRGVCVSQGL